MAKIQFSFFLLLVSFSTIAQSKTDFDKAYDLYDNGKTEEAAKLLDQIASGYQANPEFEFLRGVCHSELGNNDKAINYLSAAIKLDSNYPEAYYQRGYTYFSAGNSKNALTDFDKAISLEPSFAEAYMNRGSVKYDQNDIDGACADWKAAKALGLTLTEQLISQLCL